MLTLQAVVDFPARTCLPWQRHSDGLDCQRELPVHLIRTHPGGIRTIIWPTPHTLCPRLYQLLALCVC